MHYKGTITKIKRIFNFDAKKNSDLYETTIKVNFKGINGHTRQRLFTTSENPKLKRFSRDYALFKNDATTEEALSFFIGILLKWPGKIFITSNFFKKNFILVSEYTEKSRNLSVKMVVISNFIKKEVIYSKENTIEEEILSEIKKTLKIRIIKIPKNNGIKSLTYQ